MENLLIYNEEDIMDSLLQILKKLNSKKLFVVCGKNCSKLEIISSIIALPVDLVWFHDFMPNPTYDSVCSGVELFRKNDCTQILAIGGGSALDVAKCIKAFSTMNSDVNYLQQELINNNIDLIVIPTTAGTGSEATRFAVIYYQGEKQSISHNSLIPKYVILAPEVLTTLPLYQKKVTMLDALCHGFESYWSINSTEESQEYSRQAIEMIVENLEQYLNNTKSGNHNMLIASNLAGKAINITQTTAGHAMSYKITSICKISHGHAVALCIPKIWKYMIAHMDKCIDARGRDYLTTIFLNIANATKNSCSEGAIKWLEHLLESMELEKPVITTKVLSEMVDAVNLQRLKNTPVLLDKKSIEELYRQILVVK